MRSADPSGASDARQRSETHRVPAQADDGFERLAQEWSPDPVVLWRWQSTSMETNWLAIGSFALRESSPSNAS